MAGDVNMFLSERHEDDANADDDDDANMNTGHTTASDNTRPPPRASRAPSYDAELEVMIAGAYPERAATRPPPKSHLTCTVPPFAHFHRQSPRSGDEDSRARPSAS